MQSPTPWQLARRADRLEPSVIREILKVTERPGIISLAGGLPAPESFPVEAMRDACQRVLTDTPREALQYAASEGYGPLRDWVALQLGSQGMKVEASQVLITTGSQQGLDLVGKVLIDAGSRVAVEAPTYLGALQAFTPYEPEFVAVDCDEQGPVPDALAAAAGARFLYLLPNFQNPSGRSMGAARRAEVVQAAARAGLPLVEDNPYGELWFDAAPPPPLAAAAGEGAIYLGSFSKVLAPGLRLGYVVAPPALMPKLLQAKQAADLHTPGFNQRVRTRSSATASSTPTCHGCVRATRRSATPCARRWTSTCRRAAASTCRPAACSSGSSSLAAWMRWRCCRRRWRPAWPTCPARPSTAKRRAPTRCA
jgi:2-aminoadipate transaminase